MYILLPSNTKVTIINQQDRLDAEVMEAVLFKDCYTQNYPTVHMQMTFTLYTKRQLIRLW